MKYTLCSEYPGNCNNKQCPNVTTVIRMNDINDFFDVKNAKECTTSIVYING